jgi:hypothetical protein
MPGTRIESDPRIGLIIIKKIILCEPANTGQNNIDMRIEPMIKPKIKVIISALRFLCMFL